MQGHVLVNTVARVHAKNVFTYFAYNLCQLCKNAGAGTPPSVSAPKMLENNRKSGSFRVKRS